MVSWILYHMQTHECCHKTRTYGVTPTPGKCLELINADFKGPFHDRFWVLVFLDQFSKWPEVCLTKSESFESVKHQFNSFFSTWGYPRTLKSNNGPPFIAREAGALIFDFFVMSVGTFFSIFPIFWHLKPLKSYIVHIFHHLNPLSLFYSHLLDSTVFTTYFYDLFL